MFSAIRLISFDLDDTLWPCAPVIRRAEQQLYAWLGEHTPLIPARYSLVEMREHRLQYMRDYPDLAHDLTLVRQNTLRQLMEECGYPAQLASRAVTRFREARNQVAPFDDVLPVLLSLRDYYTLVSVTNGNAEIDKTPLSDCFDRTFSAAEVGAARPDPALFNAVLDWSGVSPASILHVGDDPMRDVQSAKQLGLCTAWMCRAGVLQTPADKDSGHADVAIEDLHQLAALLRPKKYGS